ncbi:glycosyltransferase [Leifsonia sp. AG29]|uniref:glycosyltransferase n=1 Tax=Leifsonia sp. AG29 TaxID=2598860 RepID=UPI00131C1AB4|nr:glycosyltransferase [Leifsonia sp. AG29]
MTQVIAVIPAYRPGAGFAERVAGVARQVDSVIVVDDGSPAGEGPALPPSPALEVLAGEPNRGIAHALNRGIRRALERGAEHVLTLDQDSSLPEGYVARLVERFETAPPSLRVGLVVADTVNGGREVATSTRQGVRVTGEAIQSGTLLSAEVLRRCGLMDERLVIDGVDTEYCLRVRDKGYAIAVADGTDLGHELGDMVPFRPFGIALRRGGRPVLYRYHRPFRHYYVARNSIDLAFRSARRHPRWTARLLRREALLIAVTVTAGPERAKHAAASLVGLWHGLVRRRGLMPASLARLIA